MPTQAAEYYKAKKARAELMREFAKELRTLPTECKCMMCRRPAEAVAAWWCAAMAFAAVCAAVLMGGG